MRWSKWRRAGNLPSQFVRMAFRRSDDLACPAPKVLTRVSLAAEHATCRSPRSTPNRTAPTREMTGAATAISSQHRRRAAADGIARADIPRAGTEQHISLQFPELVPFNPQERKLSRSGPRSSDPGTSRWREGRCTRSRR